MNRYLLTAKIHHIGNAEQITDKLSKQVIVLKTEENQRMEYIPFDLYNDTVSNRKVGDTITVEFKLKGKQSKNDTGKYYGSLQIISIT